jgi:hypothetical protein
MLGGCTNYLATMPEITIYMNCDTRLAINLRMFDLSDKDEFIFAIKNYNYINSDYVYLYRARKSDIDQNGEVIFKISPEVSKQIKPGAFYNFSILANAFDLREPTEYKKLTDNGVINIEYGAQDILVKPSAEEAGYDIDSIRLEYISDENIESKLSPYMSSRLVDLRLEEV